MTRALLETAGGLGLFLLGMVIMTDGLRQVAGDALQRVLRRYTASPLSGAAVGTAATALVQSSSATTVTAVGFAGAGLLTFPEALGIVFGANLGTTVTGWMVAILGFKLDLAAAMPPAVLIGTLLRLFGRGRLASGGFALAGFGLIFLGISALQAGMGDFAQVITPDRFPSDTWPGRLRLVGIGIAITLVTQSSSAGVAMAIAAVSAGAISFTQAAALVIGMDVGTTVTAAMATVGASLPARRTGLAHVLYNVMTGTAAFLLLPLFVAWAEAWLPGALLRDPEISLVAFHTAFNFLGVVAVLPVAGSFARLVERLVPDRPGPFARRLDPSLLGEPEIALRAAAPVLEELASRTFERLAEALRRGPESPPRADEFALLELGLGDVEHYVGRLAPHVEGDPVAARRAAALHVLDQLGRLLRRAPERRHLDVIASHPELRREAERLAAALPGPGQLLGSCEAPLASLHAAFDEQRGSFRERAIADADRGALGASVALDAMDAHRWLRRVCRHAWRLAHYQALLGAEVPTPIAAPSD